MADDVVLVSDVDRMFCLLLSCVVLCGCCWLLCYVAATFKDINMIIKLPRCAYNIVTPSNDVQFVFMLF